MTMYYLKPLESESTNVQLGHLYFKQLPQVILMHGMIIKCYMIQYAIFSGKETWVQILVLIFTSTVTTS